MQTVSAQHAAQRVETHDITTRDTLYTPTRLLEFGRWALVKRKCEVLTASSRLLPTSGLQGRARERRAVRKPKRRAGQEVTTHWARRSVFRRCCLRHRSAHARLRPQVREALQRVLERELHRERDRARSRFASLQHRG